ncbi:MAG: hypothetical protein U0228_06680 [Myxococcaceae bacterium]
MEKDDLRKRLEGDAEALDRAVVRLRALVPALGAWTWKARVRGLADVARAVARSELTTRKAIDRALRRARAEAWPRGATRSLVEDAASLFESLDAQLERHGFATLDDLVLAVVGQRRAVGLAERESAAAEVLDPEDPLVARLSRFTTAVAPLYGRPRDARALPLSRTEHAALTDAWTDGLLALTEAWRRVDGLDESGGVTRWLQRRAGVAPKSTRTLRTGPGALAGAEYWKHHALAAQAFAVETHFAPVKVAEPERAACFEFLLRRHDDGSARLDLDPQPASPPSKRTTAGRARTDSPQEERARAALLMLAHELRGGAPGRAALEGGVRQVAQWASTADALQGEPDWTSLRDALRLVTARSFQRSLPPLAQKGGPRRPLEQKLADFFPGS